MADKDKVGAVMVVGGGIGGIQAALDLASARFKVYLVEAKPAIGGHMAQLDKTFPTNDCAMCIVSPKLVECGRHRNIEILTDTELVGLEGQAGNFKAKVVVHPRYVDVEKCTGCGECAEVCPVHLPSEYDEGLAERRPVYRLYPQAIPNTFAIEKRGISPCRDACPIEQRTQGYIALIKEGRYEDALRTIKEDNPFPAICGRVCDHRCEEACNRGKVDEPVSIMALKRFVADTVYAQKRSVPEPMPCTQKERVAIVGSGPAGLTAAQDLVKSGYGVTVFEALPMAGGMMRVGIPAYRLPHELVEREIEEIVALGVELKLNTPVHDASRLLEEGYDAVFLAVGAHQGRKLPIPRADHHDVLVATDLLRRVNLGEEVKLGENVLVLGGGSVAIDAAMTALRLGASEVSMACLECRETMPAHEWEVEEVEKEGVEIYPSRSFASIICDGERIRGVECLEVSFMEFDAEGRLTLETVPASQHTLSADTVIFAIGQVPDLSLLSDSGVGVTRWCTIAVDPESLATGCPGIFAGGDAVTGTAFIVDAIAAGHKAARSIHRYLQGEPLGQSERRPPVAELSQEEIEERMVRGEIVMQPRAQEAKLSPMERKKRFQEFALGLTEEQAVAEAERCLGCGVCSECYQCVYACEREAIDHNMVEETREVRVGAVILAPGYEPYDARKSAEFGFGRYPNVVTSLQFERMLSASGPTGGHIQRPSDGRSPRKIAFLQCIGSRDQNHDYCSTVCCMYATKEAIMTKEHEPETEIQIFMMDMRAFSKGYEEYYHRAQERYGVKYTRCRISSLKEEPKTKDLIVRYEEDGTLLEEGYDLVVLSVGMEISERSKELGQKLGLALDEYGFCLTPTFDPLVTSRLGVYACGSFVEPKDIPETVVEASAAAAKAGELLSTSRGTLTVEPTYPPEREVEGEEPRIGVFICHCGSNIAGFLDVPGITAYAKTLPYVVHVEDNLYTCSQDSTEIIKQRIEEHRLNRVVVASCTPRTHEAIFQETIQQAGLNPYLFEMANIRNQCSWVHSHDWEGATEKAKDLVRMSVARAAVLEPLHWTELPLERSALVIGGGVAGLNAALSLAEQGFPVHLVESSERLGGNLRRVHYDIYGSDPQAYLQDLVSRVESHDLITIHQETRLVETTGFIGNFSSRLETKGKIEVIDHGAIIVATGGRDYRGSDYLYGRDERVLTQGELEELIVQEPGKVAQAREVVMIQCVPPLAQIGYCSRICCAVAVENALQIKELNPSAKVYILHKDLRTYGFLEREYEKARRKGVIFLRRDDEREPRLQNEGGDLKVSCYEEALEEEIVLHPDLVVLSTATLPSEGVKELASTLKVSLDLDGFFLEAHVKLRPLDFATDGIFLAGAAHYPKLVSEAIVQAQGAAGRAATILSQETLRVGGMVALVESDRCTACLTCARICPFDVPQLNREAMGAGAIRGAVEIEAARCRGCGICVAECPAKAIQLMHCRDVQVRTEEKALFREVVTA